MQNVRLFRRQASSPSDVTTPVNLLTGCTAYYSFDGVITDASGNGRTLTGGTPVYVDGKRGQALSEAAGANFETAFSVNPSLLSVAGWVYFHSAGATGTSNIGFYTGTSFNAFGFQAVLSTRKINARINNASTLIATVAADNWYHVAITSNGTNTVAYLNGIPTTLGVNPTVPITGFKLRVSGLPYVHVDEVGFWTRVLAENEVLAHYNSGSGFNPYA